MKNSLLLDAVAKIPFLGEMSAMSTPLAKLQVYQSSPGGSNAFIRSQSNGGGVTDRSIGDLEAATLRGLHSPGMMASPGLQRWSPLPSSFPICYFLAPPPRPCAVKAELHTVGWEVVWILR